MNAFFPEMIHHLNFLELAFFLICFNFLFCRIWVSTSYFIKSSYILSSRFFWSYSHIFSFFVAFLLVFILLLFIVWKSLTLQILTYPSCSWWYPPFLIFINLFPSRTEINILLYFLPDYFLYIGFYIGLWFICRL